MTYNVFSGTLNLSQSINLSTYLIALLYNVDVCIVKCGSYIYVSKLRSVLSVTLHMVTIDRQKHFSPYHLIKFPQLLPGFPRVTALNMLLLQFNRYCVMDNNSGRSIQVAQEM